MLGAVAERVVRGHYLVSVDKFIDDALPPSHSEAVRGGLSAEVKKRLVAVKPFDWVPVEPIVELLGAIVRTSPSDEEAAATLRRLGTSIATDSTNTFLRLIIRVATPRILASKLHDIYRKHHGFGEMKVDTSGLLGRRIVVRVQPTYEYLGAVGAGFLVFAFGALGLKNVVVEEIAIEPGQWVAAECVWVVRWDG